MGCQQEGTASERVECCEHSLVARGGAGVVGKTSTHSQITS